MLTLAILGSATAARGEPAEGEPQTGSAADSAESGVEETVPSAADVVEEPAADDASDAAEPSAPSGARAQKRTGVEEIIITGVPLEDTLQQDPVSATTFSGAEVKSLRIENVQDLADYTANMEINTRSAASNPTLFIRGIGLKDYNANAAGAVAIYQDGININAPAIQLFQLFDVGSIQVLRGPQGSVNGRNATAGAIHINSNLPDEDFGFETSFTYGNYNNIQAEGAVNVPLIEDVLTSRFAFTANFRDGITENACADWNPQAQPEFQDVEKPRLIESFLVSPETLQAEYQRDLDAGLFDPGGPFHKDSPNPVDLYTISTTKRADRRRALNDAGLKGKVLSVDDVCIIRPPGFIDALGPTMEQPNRPPAGTFVAQNVPELADFQGLEHKINNVDNWAARGVLRLRPPQSDLFGAVPGVDWILNLHGGQNRSDSAHLQMLGADAKATPGQPTVDCKDTPDSCGFKEATEEGFSERNSAEQTNDRFEGIVNVDGLEPGDARTRGEGGSDPFVGWYNRDGKELLDAWGGSLRGLWEPAEGVAVTSLTGFEWYDREIQDEGDANPLDIFPAFWNDSAWQVSQELRAEGEYGPLRWTAGLFFLHEQLDAFNLFPDTRSFRIEQSFDQQLWSGAPYVGASYEISEDLNLQGGARFTVEHKDFTLGTVTQGTQEGGVRNDAIPEQQADDTWSAPTGDVTLTWSPFARFGSAAETARNDFLNLYGKYSRQMKGGHFNAGLTIRSSIAIPRVEPVEPEFIHAVEVGWKSSWLDERLTLNVAGFRYWYKDLQVFDIENQLDELPVQKLLNSDARVWGAEVGLEVRPLPGLFVHTEFGWLDTEFVDFSVEKTISGGGPGGGTSDSTEFIYDGNPLIAAPEYSFNGVAEYTIPLWSWGWVVPQYSFNYRSKQYLDPQRLDPISQDPYWLQNARLAYRTPDERIEIAGWVENLTDEQYLIDTFDITREFSTILQVWGDPRTYGFTISYAW